MEYEHIESIIEPGTIIAILDNKISSKRHWQKYFSGRWLKDIETAETYWIGLLDFLNKHFHIEIIEKEYPKICRSRREIVVGEYK